MTRGGEWFDTAAAQQDCEADTDKAQGRLRVLGQPELVIVREREQVTQVDAGGRGALIAERRDLFVLEELGPHAGLLRSLSREEKCDGHSPSGPTGHLPSEAGEEGFIY